MRIVPIRLPTPYPVGPVNVYMLPGPPLTLLDGGPKTPQAHSALEEGLVTTGASIAPGLSEVIGHLDLLADERRLAAAPGNGLVNNLIRPAAGSRGSAGDDDGERGG